MRTQTESRLSALLIALLSGAALFALAAVFLSQQRNVPAPPAERSFGLEDKDILLFMEAAAKIRANAAFLTPAATREQLVEEAIRGYLAQKDPSSDYLTREEYRKFKESTDDRYVGIGLEIKKERDGRIVCLPYPGGPAAQAGIAAGDELKAIEAVPVRGKSVFAVASMARGKAGTALDLAVVTTSGVEKQLKIKRAAVTTESVTMSQWGRLRVVKIVSFTRDTSDKLKRILKSWEASQPLVMDLRGNAGGDLHAAIDAATLFLAQGKRIVAVETRNGSKSYDSTAATENGAGPLYLWQDEATASAAEVFTAALTENGRAVSIGNQTFGKGTMQEIIELSDGSALVLTTGRLKTPRGGSYDGSGLAPTYRVAGDTAAYARKVTELTQRAAGARPAVEK